MTTDHYQTLLAEYETMTPNNRRAGSVTISATDRGILERVTDDDGTRRAFLAGEAIDPDEADRIAAAEPRIEVAYEAGDLTFEASRTDGALTMLDGGEFVTPDGAAGKDGGFVLRGVAR